MILLITTSKLYLYILNELGIIQKALFSIIRWCSFFKDTKMALNPLCDETLHTRFYYIVEHCGGSIKKTLIYVLCDHVQMDK